LEQIEHIITHPNEHLPPKVTKILETDFSSSTDFDGKSLVTGPYLQIRDPVPGTVTAV
jgi:hypothetical protein